MILDAHKLVHSMGKSSALEECEVSSEDTLTEPDLILIESNDVVIPSEVPKESKFDTGELVENTNETQAAQSIEPCILSVPFTCTLCDAKFSQKRTFQMHQAFYHG